MMEGFGDAELLQTQLLQTQLMQTVSMRGYPVPPCSSRWRRVGLIRTHLWYRVLMWHFVQKGHSIDSSGLDADYGCFAGS